MYDVYQEIFKGQQQQFSVELFVYSALCDYYMLYLTPFTTDSEFPQNKWWQIYGMHCICGYFNYFSYFILGQYICTQGLSRVRQKL